MPTLNTMKRFGVSLLVHENPEILGDQLANFAKFFTNAYVVIHISRSTTTPYHEFEKICSEHANAVINPTRLNTRWGDMLSPIVSNIEYALTQFPDLKVICFASSTDMFVKPGVEDYIESHRIAYDSMGQVDSENKDMIVAACFNDPSFLRMQEHLGIESATYSQIEGSFYPTSLAKEILQVIKQHFDVSGCNADYYREEFVIPTIAHALTSNDQKIAMPYTLRGMFAYNWARGFGQRHKALILPSKILAKLIKLRYSNFWQLPTLQRAIKYSFSNLLRYSEVNGIKKFDPSSIHAIKRVRPVMADPVRCYLRDNV